MNIVLHYKLDYDKIRIFSNFKVIVPFNAGYVFLSTFAIFSFFFLYPMATLKFYNNKQEHIKIHFFNIFIFTNLIKNEFLMLLNMQTIQMLVKRSIYSTSIYSIYFRLWFNYAQYLYSINALTSEKIKC